MPDTKYNGWSNYPTWNVGLWLDNAEDTYSHALALASDARMETEEDGDPTGILADKLKEWLEGYMPELTGMWSDLLNHAWSEVNWTEVAGHFLED